MFSCRSDPPFVSSVPGEFQVKRQLPYCIARKETKRSKRPGVGTGRVQPDNDVQSRGKNNRQPEHSVWVNQRDPYRRNPVSEQQDKRRAKKRNKGGRGQ